MNSLSQHPESVQHQLIEHIYGVIDSKIQYIKFKLNSSIAPSNDSEHYYPNLVEAPLSRASATDLGQFRNTAILDKIETSSKTINRLLMLRVNLNKHNANLVFELLGNNDYLNYSSEELKKMVDGNPIN